LIFENNNNYFVEVMFKKIDYFCNAIHVQMYVAFTSWSLRLITLIIYLSWNYFTWNIDIKPIYPAS